MNLGTGRSFDLGLIFGDSASQFTVDDFYIEPVNASNAIARYSTSSSYPAIAHGCTISKSYSGGVISYSGYSQTISVSSKASSSQTLNGRIVASRPGASKTDLGKITTYNASGISGYTNLTVNNFVVELLSCPYTATGSGSTSSDSLLAIANGFTFTKSYNASTGVFSLSGVSQTITIGGEQGSIKSSATQSFNYKVWLIK